MSYSALSGKQLDDNAWTYSAEPLNAISSSMPRMVTTDNSSSTLADKATFPPTRKASLGRSRSLKNAFEKLSRSRSSSSKRQGEQQNEQHRVGQHAGATHGYSNTYQLASDAEPIITSSSMEPSPSADSTLSKVSTFDPPTDPTTTSWLDTYDQPMLHSLQPMPPIRRRQSSAEHVDSTSQQQQQRLRPKAKSMGNRTRQSSEKNTSQQQHQGSTTPRTPRSRSRVLRSPPPPPPTDTDHNALPSMPNVDVQQIRNEIEPVNQSITPPDRSSSLNKTADQHLTNNIISNVKRKLSIGKERKQQYTEPGRKSLPANFVSNDQQQPRKRTLSNGSRLKSGTASENERQRKTSSSSGTMGYMRPTIAHGQRSRSNDALLPPSSSSSESVTTTNELVPPVPPVPKHHSSTLSVDKTKLARPSLGSRTSSTGSSRSSSHGLSGDESIGGAAPRKTLRRQPSHGSSFGDADDSDNGGSIRSARSSARSDDDENTRKPQRLSKRSTLKVPGSRRGSTEGSSNPPRKSSLNREPTSSKPTNTTTTTRRRGKVK